MFGAFGVAVTSSSLFSLKEQQLFGGGIVGPLALCVPNWTCATNLARWNLWHTVLSPCFQWHFQRKLRPCKMCTEGVSYAFVSRLEELFELFELFKAFQSVWLHAVSSNSECNLIRDPLGWRLSLLTHWHAGGNIFSCRRYAIWSTAVDATMLSQTSSLVSFRQGDFDEECGVAQTGQASQRRQAKQINAINAAIQLTF